MPNWKTYESSVRLLSSILAAHPELKLNYAELSACFGGDCTFSALDNRFRSIKKDAKAINDARAEGIDPITLTLTQLGGATKSIADNGGGDDAGTPAKAKGGAKKGATPRKRAVAKPKAKTAPKKEKVDDDDSQAVVDMMDGDGEDEAVHSPGTLPATPRKGSNNKVITGRVAKSGGKRKAAAKAPTYVEEADDLELDDQSDVSEYELDGGEDKSSKKARGRSTGRGNGQSADENGGGSHDGNSNGNGNGHSIADVVLGDQVEEDYDAAEDDEEYAY